MGDVKPRLVEESNDKSKIWKLTEISEPSQCRSMKLPENVRVTKVCYFCAYICFYFVGFKREHVMNPDCLIFFLKISRLIYTNSGNAILALSSNAIHLLWKWQRSERNSSGKV